MVLSPPQHLLMQSLPGLKSLTAFRIVAFRPEDTCPYVGNELRRFTIDNLSHCPGLKIEYVAINSNVLRIARGARGAAKGVLKKRRSGGGAGGEAGASGGGLGGGLGVAGGVGIGPGSGAGIGPGMPDASSSGEEDADGSESDGEEGGGLVMDVVAILNFGEVEGVRIFEKDVLGGKL